MYESLLEALPGISVGPRTALAIQFGGFELAVVCCWLIYDLPTIGLVAGTVVVAVSTVGSLAMVTIADAVRAGREPARYRRFVLGSRIELVLGLVAFIGLVTYLFVVDPRESPVLLDTLLGPDPPAPAVFLLLLLSWDVCYRIGTAWWAGVTGLWRTLGLPADRRGSRHRRRLDLATLSFGVLQLSLLPFVLNHPLLVVGVAGHVAAVVLVIGTARLLEARGSQN
ncbi:MAG: hypothetical protein V5A43_00660 [Haloarculaceae archaeon]